MNCEPGDSGGGSSGDLVHHFSRPSLRDQPDYSQRSQSSFLRDFYTSGSGQVSITTDDSSFSTGIHSPGGGPAKHSRDHIYHYPFSSSDDIGHQSASSLLPPMTRDDESYTADVKYNDDHPEVEVNTFGFYQIHQNQYDQHPPRQHSHRQLRMQQPCTREESLRCLDRGVPDGDDRIFDDEELHCRNGCGRRCFDPRPGDGQLPLTEPGQVLNGEGLSCNPGMAHLDRKREARERGSSFCSHNEDGGADAAFVEAKMGTGDMSGGPPAARAGGGHSSTEKSDRATNAVVDYDDEEVQKQIDFVEQLGIINVSSAQYENHNHDGRGMMGSPPSNLNHHHPFSSNHPMTALGRGGNRSSIIDNDEELIGLNPYRPPSSIRRSTIRPPGPPPKEGRPMLAPGPVEPNKPPPKANRRFNAHRGPRVPELCRGVLMSDVSKNEEDSAGEVVLGEREHVVKCQTCKSLLKVDKFATLVSCPRCEAVCAASSTRV